jgi:hypothetical protein
MEWLAKNISTEGIEPEYKYQTLAVLFLLLAIVTMHVTARFWTLQNKNISTGGIEAESKYPILYVLFFLLAIVNVRLLPHSEHYTLLTEPCRFVLKETEKRLGNCLYFYIEF